MEIGNSNIHNFQDNQGNTLAHYAAANGQKKLLEQGYNARKMTLKERNNWGYTPLLFAVINGHTKTVEWLIHQGIDCRKKLTITNINAFLLAAENGHTRTLESLIKGGASLYDKNDHLDSAAHYAARQGYTETLNWLIKQGLSPVEPNKFGMIPVYLAATRGYTTTVKFLVNHGANIHESDNYGNTPLLVAAKYGHLDTVKWLLQYKANLEKKNDQGQNALTLAFNNNALTVVQFLLKCDANFDGNVISDDQAKILAQVLAATHKLTSLNLSHSGMNIVKINHLKKVLSQHPNLEILQVDENSALGEEGVAILLDICEKNLQLKKVTATNTGASKAQKNYLATLNSREDTRDKNSALLSATFFAVPHNPINKEATAKDQQKFFNP